MNRRQLVTQIRKKMTEVGGFSAAAETLLIRYE
jgi:hypothetical protein